MPKNLICLNYSYLQLGTPVAKKDLIATKESLIFIAYRRHGQYIKRKLSKIWLALIAILPVL